MEEILDFIKHFSNAQTTFLHGCCYWFTRILTERFGKSHYVSVLYEPVDGHFVTQIRPKKMVMDRNGKISYKTDNSYTWLFDVRGDVTDLYADKQLYDLQAIKAIDPKWYSRLMRDCRDFINPDDEEKIVEIHSVKPDWKLRSCYVRKKEEIDPKPIA